MNIEAGLWFLLMVIFIIVEANTVALVSVWFCIGALGSMLAALFGAPVWLQICLFFVISGLTMLAFRPLLKKQFNAKVHKTNLDAVIGSVGTVLDPIDNIQSTGRVKLGGMEWSARSSSGAPIAAGAVVKVDRIEGVKVFVSISEEALPVK